MGKMMTDTKVIKEKIKELRAMLLAPYNGDIKKRNEEIIKKRSRGMTLQKIGEENGLTRERIRQIVGNSPVDLKKSSKESYKKSFIDKFWDKVNKRGDDDCWEWMKGKSKAGYGRVNNRLLKDGYAHRLAWILTNGEIPDGMDVLHKCDNPPCCNPNHLFLGTQADNNRDRDAKGRGKIGIGIGGRRPETVDRNQRIVADYESGMGYELLIEKYHLSFKYIYDIAHKYNYAETDRE